MYMRLFLLVLLMLGTLGFGKDIEVRSGDFAYFGAVVPSANVAGQEGKITLSAYDAYGNKTNYFGKKGRSFALKATGSATFDKQTFTTADFEAGSVTISISDRVAESLSIALFEGENQLMVKNMTTGTFVQSFNLNFSQPTLGSFDVSVPEALVAGEEFKVTITAKDKVGNIVTGYNDIADGVVVTAAGQNGKISLLVPAHSFTNGRAEVSFRCDFSGEATIFVTDISDQSAKGSVGPLTFQNQGLARIEVNAPESIRAGEPFVVELRAINQFGRAMKNYGAIGEDIILQANGKGELLPNRVPAKAFLRGVARFETLYTIPEPITITAEPVQTPMVKPEMAFNAPSKLAAVQEAQTTKPASEAVEAAAVQPETVRQEAVQQEAVQQEAVQPEAVQQEAVPQETVQPEAVQQEAVQPEAVQSETTEAKSPADETPKQKSSFPLSFRFDSSLGDIDRIESEYIPAGNLGTTRIYVRFVNTKKVKSVQPISKDITVDGRVIGTLFVSGTFDKQGRLKMEIKENEPFSVDVKNGGQSLDLFFFLDN